jgi:hypothetical protein
MHSFKPAARRSGRYAGFLLFSAFFLLVSLHSGAAFSASLAVKIRQLNPDGQIQQVTCVNHQQCILQLGIRTAQAQTETLNVHVLFVPGNVLLEFETPKGYLYAGPKTAAAKHVDYRTIWRNTSALNKPFADDVTLFLPLVAHPAAPRLNVAQQPVADLEVTTEQVP